MSKAFTIVELLVATALLLVGFIFIFALFAPSFQGMAKSRNIGYASQLAQQNLESLAAWYSVTAGAGTPPGGGFGTQTLVAKVKGVPAQTTFTWQVKATGDPDPVNLASAGPPPSYNLIHIVSWVRWAEKGSTNIAPPLGAPANIQGGYGVHFLVVETRTYCFTPCH